MCDMCTGTCVKVHEGGSEDSSVSLFCLLDFCFEDQTEATRLGFDSTLTQS